MSDDDTLYLLLPTTEQQRPPGRARKARGWVTFEVPKDVGSFEVVADSGGGRYLRWRIDKP